MAAVGLIAKFAEADAGAIAGIANDVAAAVASAGIAALESTCVMKDLEVSVLQQPASCRGDVRWSQVPARGFCPSALLDRARICNDILC